MGLKPDKRTDICGHFQISGSIIRYLAVSSDIFRYLQISSGIIRYLAVSSGIFRYLRVSLDNDGMVQPIANRASRTKLRRIGMTGVLPDQHKTGCWVEFVAGRMGPRKTRAQARVPAPPHSWAWGGVAFSAFPAPVPFQAPTPPISQTGPRYK